MTSFTNVTMATGHHVCAPLLCLAQQASDRPILLDEEIDVAQQPDVMAASTGAQLLRRIALLSRALSNCLSIPPGSINVIIAQSSAVAMEAMMAVLDAGCVLCPVNWRWTPQELSQALQRLSPALVLFDRACSDLAAKSLSMAYTATKPLDPSAADTPRPAVPIPYLCRINHTEPSLTQMGTGRKQPSGHNATSSFNILTTSELLAAASMGSAVQCRVTAAASGTHTSAPGRVLAAAPLLDPSPQPAPPQLTSPPPVLQLRSSPCGTALLVFTSGTTAAPKAVRLSHAAFHAQSLVKLALVGYSPADTYLHLAPLFHIGGLSSAFAALMAGCRQVFLPRFEPAATLRAIARHRVSAFIAVPTMLQDLAAASASATAAAALPPGMQPASNRPGDAAAVDPAASLGLGCVRKILVGAGGTAPSLQDAVSRVFPCAELISAYGMTEACSSMTFRHLRSAAAGPASAAQVWAPPTSTTTSARGIRPCGDPAADVATCVGWPGPGVQIKIRAAGTGEDPRPAPPSISGGASPGTPGTNTTGGSRSRGTAPGASESGCAPPHVVGEVLTRGPHVMLGYWNDSAATAEVLSSDGWLRTGDLGYMAEDGSLWLMGRSKDMIKSGGENVFAPQVEAVLCSHPAVAAAAVVGLPDERLGEQVAALLVLRDGWTFEGPSLPYQQPTPATAGSTTAASGPGAGGGNGSAVRRLSLADLQAHCRSQGLAGFRLPRFVAAQREPLPTNSSGKVQKPDVRGRLLALRTGAGSAVALSRL